MTDDDWIICPWCSSDEPVLDPDPTNVVVGLHENEAGESVLSFRCQECTKTWGMIV